MIHPKSTLYIPELPEPEKQGEREHDGIVEAIRFRTKRELRTEQGMLSREGLKKIVEEAQAREAHILRKLFYFLDHIGGTGVVRITLSEEGKQAIDPIREDILFLVRYRLGKLEYEEIEELLFRTGDDPFRIIIEYGQETKHFKMLYIKRIILEPLDGPSKPIE